MSSAAIKAAGAFIELRLQDKMRLGLQRVTRNFRSFAANLEQVGARITAISFTPVLGFGKAIRTFAQFEDSILSLQSISRKSSGFDFTTLVETIKKLGRETSFTARQVADASVTLARAGFHQEEINDSMQSVLDLSRATGTDLAMAADVAAKSIRSFQLETKDAGHVIDVLAATANNSAQTLEDLFESLKLAAPLAVRTNRTLEETAAALGVLANAGVKGTLAATALNRATANFSTLAGQAALKEMGVDAVIHAPVHIETILQPFDENDVHFAATLDAKTPAKIGQVLGVTLDPAAEDDVVRVRTTGIVPVTVDIVHELHTHANMFDLSPELRSGFGGYPIIYKHTAGTGSTLCLVQLGIYSLANGQVRLDTVFDGGTSATCTWVDVGGDDAGEFTVQNWTGVDLDGTSTAINLYVIESPENHELYAISQDCG